MFGSSRLLILKPSQHLNVSPFRTQPNKPHQSQYCIGSVGNQFTLKAQWVDWASENERLNHRAFPLTWRPDEHNQSLRPANSRANSFNTRLL